MLTCRDGGCLRKTRTALLICLVSCGSCSAPDSRTQGARRGDKSEPAFNERGERRTTDGNSLFLVDGTPTPSVPIGRLLFLFARPQRDRISAPRGEASDTLVFAGGVDGLYTASAPLGDSSGFASTPALEDPRFGIPNPTPTPTVTPTPTPSVFPRPVGTIFPRPTIPAFSPFRRPPAPAVPEPTRWEGPGAYMNRWDVFTPDRFTIETEAGDCLNC